MVSSNKFPEQSEDSDEAKDAGEDKASQSNTTPCKAEYITGGLGDPRLKAQQFLFINDVDPDGQTNKKQMHSKIRSHAMSTVRQRQRQIDCMRHAELQNLAPNSPDRVLSLSGISEHLNDGIMSISLLELSRKHWATAERHIHLTLPTFWEQESLRRITSVTSNTPSTFHALYQMPVEHRIQACLKDPLHAYATLALCTSCSCYMLNHSHDRAVAGIFMTCALGALRRRCNQPGSFDQELVFSMICLCRAETWRGDFVAALAHMRMIHYIIQVLDGKSTFDPLILDIALFVDKHIALNLFQPPLLTYSFDPGPTMWPSLWHKKPHSPEIERAFITVGSSLMRGRMRQTLGFELSGIIRDLRDCILVALDVHSFSDSKVIESRYARWFLLRTTAISHRLLKLPRDMASPEKRSQFCVQATLLIWISLITTGFSAPQTREKWIERLSTALDACMEDRGTPGALDPEVLLWVANLGTSVTCKKTEPKGFFSSALDQLAAQLGLQTEASIREVCENSFYLSSVQDDPVGHAIACVPRLAFELAVPSPTPHTLLECCNDDTPV